MAIDLFAGRDPHRTGMAEKAFRCASSGGIYVYAPRLFLVEIAGVLVKFLSPSIVKDVVERFGEEILITGDDLYFEKSIKIALATGSRGADAYYIGLAETLNAPLATSDKVQAQNARKAGAKAFYILNKRELEELIKLLGWKE